MPLGSQAYMLSHVHTDNLEGAGIELGFQANTLTTGPPFLTPVQAIEGGLSNSRCQTELSFPAQQMECWVSNQIRCELQPHEGACLLLPPETAATILVLNSRCSRVLEWGGENKN